jgi:hypothetical protein
MTTQDKELRSILELDLDPIKVKLMHEQSGEGWTLEKTTAVEREYRRFLILMKMYPNEPTAPLEDVDTFWHYHILDTMKYAADCEVIFGYFLHHFPYVGMRGQEDAADLVRIGARMQELYEVTFNESYAAAAAAFCTRAPSTELTPAFCTRAPAAAVKAAFCTRAPEPALAAAFCTRAPQPALKAAFCTRAPEPELRAAFCTRAPEPAQKAAFCTRAPEVKQQAAFCTRAPEAAQAAFCTRAPEAAQAAFCTRAPQTEASPAARELSRLTTERPSLKPGKH